MARSGSQALTEREAQIMGVLWSHGDATAEQVREWLPDRPHDSTVRTLLRVLETKGYVVRQGPGRPASVPGGGEPGEGAAEAHCTAC